MTDDRTKATSLLNSAVGSNERQEELMLLLYDELKGLAGKLFRYERAGHTLQPTAVVNEAYARLIDGTNVDWKGRSHFFATAAKAMRRLLAEHARRKNALKRGNDAQRVSLIDYEEESGSDPIDCIALEEALTQLGKTRPRLSQHAELRFFGGMTIEEVAAVQEISRETAKKDWQFARAWLNRELSKGDSYGA